MCQPVKYQPVSLYNSSYHNAHANWIFSLFKTHLMSHAQHTWSSFVYFVWIWQMSELHVFCVKLCLAKLWSHNSFDTFYLCNIQLRIQDLFEHIVPSLVWHILAPSLWSWTRLSVIRREKKHKKSSLHICLSAKAQLGFFFTN